MSILTPRPTSCSTAAFATRSDGHEHCEYCGSLSVKDAVELLKTPGTRFSGSDWKYGWPHKFYVDHASWHAKFYSAHLQKATDAELAAFSEASKACFGISWTRDAKGVAFRAPQTKSSYGWQLNGVVGADGVPVHGEHCQKAAELAARLFAPHV